MLAFTVQKVEARGRKFPRVTFLGVTITGDALHCEKFWVEAPPEPGATPVVFYNEGEEQSNIVINWPEQLKNAEQWLWNAARFPIVETERLVEK